MNLQNVNCVYHCAHKMHKHANSEQQQQQMQYLVFWDTLQQDLFRIFLPLQSYEVHLVHAQPFVNFFGNATNIVLGSAP